MINNLYRVAAISLLVLYISGCRDEAALASLEYAGGPLWESLSLHLQINAGGWTQEIRQSDFHRDHRGHFTTGEFETTAKGNLEIDFTLLALDGTPVSTGTVELPLKPDWRWNIVLTRAAEDPKILCFGCFGSKAFNLDPKFRESEKEMVWVYWGGNSISNPVVY